MQDPLEWERCFQIWGGMVPNEVEQAMLDRWSSASFPVVDAIHDAKQVIAVGDIHGDFTLLVTILTQSGVLTFRQRKWVWIGAPQTYVVLCGDLVDMYRAPHGETSPMHTGQVQFAEWKILALLNDLWFQSGGCVIRLLGNHEWMLLQGDHRYRSPLSLYEDSLRVQPPGELWTQPRGIYRRFLTACGGMRCVVRIQNWIFCHGGIVSSYLDSIAPHTLGIVPKIREERPHPLSHAFSFSHEWRSTTALDGDVALATLNHLSSQLHPIMMRDDGILWTRVYSEHPHLCKELERTLHRLYPSPPVPTGSYRPVRMVVAHCAQAYVGMGQDLHPIARYCMKPAPDPARSHVDVFALPAQRCVYCREDETELGCPTYPGINFDCVADATGLGTLFRIDCAMSGAFRPKVTSPAWDEATRPQWLVVSFANGNETVTLEKKKMHT